MMLKEALLILLGAAISKAIRSIPHSVNGNQPLAVDDSSNEDGVILTQTLSPPATNYDVFLSFRGEDTRHTFASHLYNALRNAGIVTFMDDQLHKGEQISPVLLRTIEESEISVIIFSESYASSTWCMEELVHILECKEKFGRVVIPIFYNVDPSNIRKQNGSFGKGFDVLKRRFKGNQERLQKWSNALNQSTSLSGWDSKGTRPEFKLIEEIVKDTLRKLKNKSSSHLKGLVGIAGNIENVEKLLREARIVGIWGMGGAGKTTLAKAIFQKLKGRLDAFCFIDNVREQLARIGFDELQKNCLKELLRDEDINICDIKSDSVKKRLQRKTILLILDDVDNSIMAAYLSEVCDLFGEGSRIIITSRDMQVLKNAFASATYHVPGLAFDDALHLFSLKAFKQNEPLEGYMELSKSVVGYCQGNPLALVVLGCSLLGRGEKEWESALEKLMQAPPNGKIVDVLKVSFDGLDENQKNMFLDIAFFIKEGVDVSLDLIRGLYGSCVDIDLGVLNDRSLISVSLKGNIKMHDLLRDMDAEIARQESLSNPNGPVRMRSHRDIYDFFINPKAGIERIRCVSLDVSKMKKIIELRASDFGKMHNLIFLRVYKSDDDRKKPSKLNICGDLDYLSQELRFFCWEEYPLPHVPLHFFAENLVILRMHNSNIRQLGNGSEHFPNLKVMDLRGSKYLRTLPDLCRTPKIERIHLIGCESLAQIHSASNIPLGRTLDLVMARNKGVRVKLGGRTSSSSSSSSSGFVIGDTYLDLDMLRLRRGRMKVWVSGNVICDVAFNYEEMPLEEVAPELRKAAQNLGQLLPFVKGVELKEGPIEFGGHDFNQHFTCHYDMDFCRFDIYVLKREEGGGGGGERGEVGPSITTTTTLILEQELEEEEELEDDGESNKSSSVVSILTRRLVPFYTITRWSLLTQLTLKESHVIVKSGNNDSNNSELEPTMMLRSVMGISSNDHRYYCNYIISPNRLLQRTHHKYIFPYYAFSFSLRTNYDHLFHRMIYYFII